MNRPLAQLLVWIAGNSLAGAAVGLVVGFFRQGGVERPLVLMSVLFGNVVGLTVLVSSIALFPRLPRFAPLARSLLLITSLLSGAVVGTAAVLYLFPLYVLRDLRQAAAIAAVNGTLALIVGGVVYVYEGLRREIAESLREVREVRLVEARLREEAARAKLAALQARINPHFFFNALNTISSLLEEDPREAERNIERLASLFRYTFEVADVGPVPLGEELEFIDGYLGIERARFGDHLRVVWDVDPAARTLPVPGLVLQPLVENAVVHGVAPSVEGGTVRILARGGVPVNHATNFSDGTLELVVEDDGVGFAGEPERLVRENHGLHNVRQRLLSLYGDRARLELERRSPARGTRVRIRIPTGARAWGRPATEEVGS